MSTVHPVSAVIPQPSADQISTLRRELDPTRPDTFAAYGIQAQSAAAEACRPLVNGESARLSEAARQQLAAATDGVKGLNPAGLSPKRGLAGLFDSRGGRLKRMRQAFADTDRRLAGLGAELKAQAGNFKARLAQIDPAHEGLRQPIVDLGAWIEAGRQRLADASPEAPDGEVSARDQLSARLEQLSAARMSALAHLPLARTMQNADAVAAERLEAAAAAVETWREDWSKALGLQGKRRRKVQPEPAQLAQASERLTARLNGARQALDDGASRRRQATERLNALQRDITGATVEG